VGSLFVDSGKLRVEANSEHFLSLSTIHHSHLRR
jgi:hypothetical protein